ncbi:hypothetical protein HCG49_08295 [Arenibacter sp. 6A1]|uniref:hypothetical protein n=1 Tax=Arenibacter sp. 6A1 TaxID=2720391 RepID=UPI001446444E|nr:hypothetical protein [Arenibacter sp. 6A1]NKI26561.1 hypothetical protein [Arenibacter sp. 6A1]
MLSEIRIKNSLGIVNLYFKNLFEYLSEKEFLTFIEKGFEFMDKNNGLNTKTNFITSFNNLLLEHQFNNSNIIRNEFSYFNYLLGEFKSYGEFKDFKDLIKASLFNFEKHSFHHVLGEIATCLILSEKYAFKKYEKELVNKRSIDFEFLNRQNETIYIDVKTIDYNISKYEKEKFSDFLNSRLKQYYEDKTEKLDFETKKKIFIFPIISGLNLEIIKENQEYLNTIYESSTLEIDKFQSFSPRIFGNIQDTFFRLFSINEIINPEKNFK